MSTERRIDLLGRVSVRAGTTVLDEFPTVHCRSLLVFLAIHPDIEHPRDRLVQAVWPGAKDGSARNRLSVTLYHLRQALESVDPGFGKVFLASRSAMRLDSSLAQIDLHEFRRHVSEGRAARDAETKRKHFTHAVALYKGPLAPDALVEWAVARQFEASEMFQDAAVWLALEHEMKGEREKAQAVLSRALDVEPFSERATELLTNWYAQTGRIEMAVACAKRMQRSMSSHGLVPSKTMISRIEELNVMMSGQARAAAFADEVVVTVLACTDVAFEDFGKTVRDRGGQVYGGGLFGLFMNPLIALEAGREIIEKASEAVVLLCPVLMAMNDPMPADVRSKLSALRSTGVFGTECFASLARTKGVASREVVLRGEKFWRLE